VVATIEAGLHASSPAEAPGVAPAGGGREKAGWHRTVMAREVADCVVGAPGGVYLDLTLGDGGHARAILDAAGDEARLVGIDCDPLAIRRATERLGTRYGDRFAAVRGNFRDLPEILGGLGVGRVDGMVADLGPSSRQLVDDPELGFSFAAGPLDMRMDPDGGPSLSARLAAVNERELGRVIREYGGEPRARAAARAILRARGEGRLTDTAALAGVVARAVGGGRRRLHPATRTFQALRIWTNDEVGALEDLLGRLPDPLKPSGRGCFVAFHSGEDRVIKRRLRELAGACRCPSNMPVCGCGAIALIQVLTARARRPCPAEISENPRARSARLRAFERRGG
jgi:16S rRNA (cytosine1402-N4)-methyltransferase